MTLVRRRQATVVVDGRNATGETVRLEARQAVVTLPLGVLQAKFPGSGAVIFDPPLREKEDALGKLAMGPVVRLVLQFDSTFWENSSLMGNGALRDLHFLFTRNPVFPTFWTTMPLRLPLLVAWCAGSGAAAKARWSQPELEQEALRSLSRALRLPEPALTRHFVRSYFHDWQADPFSWGAYSYVLAGGMGAQSSLATPLFGRLFFAGEATQSDGHHATVHGAFHSGIRAASEALESSQQLS